MKDADLPAESEYCQVCRFPLMLLKIRTPAEHIQKCKDRNLPQLKCSEGISCQSKMESHYQLFSHDDSPPSGSVATKTENLNNNSNMMFPFIDLTDSQTSSEDFAAPILPSSKNRSNFLKSSQAQLYKSKVSVPSTPHSRKRRLSKNSSKEQVKKPSLKEENVSFTLKCTQTPFTIALQQRRNLQHKKSKLENYDSIDLTQDGSNDEQGAVSKNKSHLWKHSRIVNLCDSSSSETDLVDKPFIPLHRSNASSRQMKRPFLSCTEGHSMESNKKPALSAVRENPTSKLDDDLKHVFQSTQADKTPSSVLTSLETLDSEDFSTPPPRGPGFVPTGITAIVHDTTRNHGLHIESDEEEDFFSMSPLGKSSDLKFADSRSCSDQGDSSSKNSNPQEKIQSEKAKHGLQINFDENNLLSKIPIEISFHADSDRDGGGGEGSVSEDLRATKKILNGNEVRHGLQIDFDKEDGFHVRPLEISLNGSLDETVLCPDEENPPTKGQPMNSGISSSNPSAEKTLETNPAMYPQHLKHKKDIEIEQQSSELIEDCANDACPSFEMPTADVGLSFSESDQDDYRFLDFASADTVPFTGPPNILKDIQCNSLTVNKEIADNDLIDSMDNFECRSSAILQQDSRSFQSSNSSLHGDINNNLPVAEEKPSSNIEDVNVDGKISLKRQDCDQSKSLETITNRPASSEKSSDVVQKSADESTVHGDLTEKIPPPVFSNELTKHSPAQTASDSQHCGSELQIVPPNSSIHNPVQSKNCNRPSPLPKSFLLPSPKNVRVVQQHPIQTNVSVLKCTRALDFDGSQYRTSHSTNTGSKAHCSNIDSSKDDYTETEKSDKSAVSKRPTETSRMSTMGADQIKLTSRKCDRRNSPAKTDWPDENESTKENVIASTVADKGGNQLGKGTLSTGQKIIKQGDIGAMLFGMKPRVRQEPVENENSTKRHTNRRFQEGYSNKPRPCPFYKKIAGTDIAVDAFSYGSVPGITFYFLSHFHFDHYMGLQRKGWKDKIFCGPVTGNLLAGVLRIPEYLIIRLPLWQETPIGDVRVTLLDANHCPGAVLFLFKLKNNNVIVHSGDFRAVPEMERYSALNDITISTLHLDTTYLNPKYRFPPQSAVIEAAVAIVMKSIQECQKTLFVVGSYDIGKEKIICNIAKALKSKIYILPRKMNIVKCLGNEEIRQLVTTRVSAACKVHVIPMRSLNTKHLRSMLSQHCFFNRIVAIKPTGWTQGRKTRDLNHIKPAGSGNVKIYGLPYSEHSSFDELRRFVKFTRPKRVIPTVNVGQAETRNMMNVYLNAWKDGQDVSDD